MSGIQAERPFRDILTELTFEAAEQGLDPFDAYVRLREKMSTLRLRAEDYCSSSITSGGHARNDSLDMRQIIQRNTDTAINLCDELFQVGQLSPRTAIEAVVLGKLPWKQSEYMTFWLATMSGLPARGHGIVKAIAGFQHDFVTAQGDNELLDMSVYDSNVSPNIRAPHYFAHAQTFAATAKKHNPEPIRRLVRLVDPEMSLGAQTENVFAKLMGVQVCRVAIAQTGLEPNQANLPPRLVNDTEQLIRFGATVFDMASRQQLILVPQADV